MKKINIRLSHVLFVLIIIVSFSFSYKGEKDAMHKRIFDLTVFEFRDGKPKAKSEADELEFKDGKLFSTFLYEKLEYKWVRYEIKKDTVYMDEDSEKHDWIVEASHTNEKDETIVMVFKVTDWELEGSYKLTKKDKLKKYFEFTGKERIKVKKEKKSKDGTEGK